MGQITWQSGQRIYLDTNLFIYAVEQIEPFVRQVEEVFQAADQGEIILVTSLLTLAEILVMPYRKADDVLINIYRELFTCPPPGLYVAPLNWEILDHAARLRAIVPGLRLPDVIHLATANSEGCDLVVTNDRRMETAKDMHITILG